MTSKFKLEMSNRNEINEQPLDFVPSDIINFLKMPSVKLDKDVPLPAVKRVKHTKENKKEKSSTMLLFPDASFIRGQEISKLNILEEKPLINSIIPAEYFIQKDELTRFVDYNDCELNSFEELEKNQIIFPTRYPQNRWEVACLLKTLYRILDDQNNPDRRFIDTVINRKENIDSLIDLIVELDSVYHLIFHELGRQISTTSHERGSIVMELRRKYMEFIEFLPENLNKLKEEIEMQDVKDKLLTNKIDEFQGAIRYLTEQLVEVRNRDVKVTKNAENLQNKLEAALEESNRSKELLNEYHILYDLQKQRLDMQISAINQEKEEWSSLAFALTLKICDESLLYTCKNLRLSAKKLIQLSQHFAIYISDCDTMLTTKIQGSSDRCLQLITKIQTSTNKLNNNFYDIFHYLKERFKTFKEQNLFSQDPKVLLNSLSNNISALRGFFMEDIFKKFVGELSEHNNQDLTEQLSEVSVLIDEMKQLVEQVADRSDTTKSQNEKGKDPLDLSTSFESLKAWCVEFYNRIKIIQDFQKFFDDFQSKVQSIEVTITEYMSRCSMDNSSISDLILLVNDFYLESFENPDFAKIEKNKDFAEFNRFYSELQKTVATFSRQIDAFDADLILNINSLQVSMTYWLVDVLILLTNLEQLENIEESYKNVCKKFENIMNTDQSLYQYILNCTEHQLVLTSENQEMKLMELEEFKNEHNQWRNIAEMLIKDIGKKIESGLRMQKMSDRIVESIDLENIDQIIDDISSRSTDKDIYLALMTVKNLREEVKDADQRIAVATLNELEMIPKLNELKVHIEEFEQKTQAITEEYQELIKT